VRVVAKTYFRIFWVWGCVWFLVNDDVLLAATRIEQLPAKLQGKIYLIGVGLIPVAFIIAGIYFLSGSQEAKMKVNGAIAGAVLILGATAMVTLLKGVM
jgi:hypothetical protein